jgi:hypothetical protein
VILLLLLPDTACAIGGRLEIQIPRSTAHPDGLWLGSYGLDPSANGQPPEAACMVALAQALATMLEADELPELPALISLESPQPRTVEALGRLQSRIRRGDWPPMPARLLLLARRLSGKLAAIRVQVSRSRSEDMLTVAAAVAREDARDRLAPYMPAGLWGMV